MVGCKKALLRLWTDRFSVIEQRKVKRSNGSTGFEEAAVFEDQPCKLSFSTLAAANQQDMTAAVVQTVKLFCDRDLMIRAGSKITVQHMGKIFEFSQSGEPGVFTNHQEIVLVLFRGWA